MFIADYDLEEVKGESCKLLKKWGIKFRVKKFDQKTVEKKEANSVFKTHLDRLSQEKTKLKQYDQPIFIPAFVLEACNYLRNKIDTEGIFRKSGVVARQKEMKQVLVNGGRLVVNGDCKANDIADLLKLFFRELPEPCIPYVFHDTLQRCLDNSERSKEAVFLTLLIIPSVYLYTLAYLMQFLQEVASHSQYNHMDASNLAIVWTPNLMPFKTGRVDDKQAFNKRIAIIQMLIEDACQIGVIPECLYDMLPSWQPSNSLSSHDELEHSRHRYKKKKRRSGSLTRMLSGIRKMVKGKVAEETEITTPENSVTIPHTPRIMSTGKKRKASESNLTAFSAKKRKDLLESLPQCAVLPDVCTTTHLTPRVLLPQLHTTNFTGDEVEPKRRSRFCMNKKERGEKKTSRSQSSSRLRLSGFGFSRKASLNKTAKMEDSGLELTRTPDSLDLTTKDFDHMMMLSKYELDVKDMEKRVSNIERMSAELQNIEGISMSDIELTPDRSPGNSLKTVQTAYEKTLESTEKFNSPTCDELAKRLSKELKIRGSSGKKVVRSPSARKIGTIRRRSREGVPKIKRNLSLDITGMVLSSHSFNQNGHRVGKSDTPRNCLPNPSIKPTDTLQEHFKNQLKSQAYENQRESCSGSFGHESNDLLSFGVLTRSKTQRASSFHGYDFNREPINTPNSVKTENTNTSIDSLVWKNAETFLNEEVKSEEKPTTGRPSLAKIRSQNAGMVLAKAKMFNTMTCSNKDSDPPINLNSKCQGLQKKNSSKSSKDKKLPRKKSGNEKKQANQETALESSSSLVKTDMKSLSDNKVKKNIRSNESAHYHQIKGNKGSIRKTSLLDQNVLRAQHPIINKLKANHLHISSPLRDRNFLNSPRVCGVTNIGKTNTPRVPRQLPTNQVKTAAKKPAGSTPRRSPRQPSYKSKYVTKSLV